MAKNKYTGICYVIRKDGSTVSLSELTAEERKAMEERMRERLSITMSAYYSAHLEEYKKL